MEQLEQHTNDVLARVAEKQREHQQRKWAWLINANIKLDAPREHAVPRGVEQAEKGAA